jgi:Sulfotransferase domain
MNNPVSKLGRTVLGEEKYLKARKVYSEGIQRRLAALLSLPLYQFRQVTASNRVLPDFLIIGAPKAGTSSLYAYLVQHKAILPASRKEVHYFDRFLDRGLNWYRAHFPLALWMNLLSARRITGEATPNYLASPAVAAAAHDLLPEAKLIVLLRNPVERAYSHYYFAIARQRKARHTFDEAIRIEMQKLEEADSAASRLAAAPYLMHGHYAENLERWFNCFPRSQFLILQAEVLFREPKLVLSEALQFLGMPDDGLEKANYRAENVGKKPDRISAEMRAILQDYFRPLNERLYKLLSQTFDWD